MSFSKQNNRIEFDRGCHCQNCEFIIHKQKRRKDEKVLRQDKNFSTRLPYANEKIMEIYYSIVNIKSKTIEEMGDKIHILKSETKIKFYKIISDYYDEMDYRRQSKTFNLRKILLLKMLKAKVKFFTKYYY